MADKKKKNRFSGTATSDAEIQSISENAYRESGQAERNRQAGIETGSKRGAGTRPEHAGKVYDAASKALGNKPARERSNGVEVLVQAQKNLQGDGKPTLLQQIRDAADTEAEMTFGKAWDPTAEERGRVGNTLAAGGKGWMAGQANALGFLLDPTDDGSMTDAEMMFGHAADDLGNNRVAQWLNEKRGEASEKLYGAADKLNEEAGQSEAKAKEGLGKVGQILVDVGIAGTQLAADATLGRLTGAGMTTMGTRTFGGAAREALDAGATQQQAFNYGASSAAVEMLAEKMFDVGRIFGKGAGDELIEKAVKKWATSDTGRAALRTFFGVLTEGGEEAASDLVNPIIRMFYDSDAVKETYGTAEGRKQLGRDILHDATVGGVLGGFGTVVTGQNRAKNAELRADEARAQEAERQENIAKSAAMNERFAENRMQTGTADAEAAATLAQNQIRAARPQTVAAFSKAVSGEQITPAETAAILNDTELMQQLVNAAGRTVDDGDVRGAFLQMMEENGTPLQNATESPVLNPEVSEGGLTENDVTADYSANAERSAQESEKAGRVTTIKSPYQGKTPQIVNVDLIESDGSLVGPEPTATIGGSNPQDNSIPNSTPKVKSDAEIMREAAGIRTFEDQDARAGAGSAQTHIDNRTKADVSNPRVKAFQHEHPELHEHFVNAAQKIAEEAAVSLDAGVTKVAKKYGGGTKAQYAKGIAKVMEKTGLSRQKIITACEDIINDRGSENYADAKRVEMALDSLMSGAVFGYEDAEYVRKKGELEGGTPVGSWEEYLKSEQLSLLTGEVTEEQLREEWLQQVLERNAQQAETGLPEGHGAMSPAFPYREAQSQTHSSDALYNEEERAMEGLRPEDRRHQVRTDADVIQHAEERLAFDYEGEKEALFQPDAEWDAVDVEAVHQIQAAEIEKARQTGDYSEVIRLQKLKDAHASNWGQVGHTMARHADSVESIVSEAARDLDNAGNVTPDEMRDVLNQVTEFAAEREAIREGENEQLLELIRTMNAARRTGGLFTPERTGRTLEKTMQAVLEQDGGFDYLWQVAGQQIRNFASDRAPISGIEAAKSIRYMSMLSKLTTIMRNLVGNNVFDPIESVSGNIAVPIDMLLSMATGRRTTGLDASWFSRAKRRGSVDGMQRAYIAAALDADPEDGESRWEVRNGRTFKMARNPLFRFLSTVEKWQQYALQVTDEMQKGGIAAETQRQIDRLKERGLLEQDALQGWADETARQRTFQNQGAVSDLMMGARNLLNGGESGRLSIRDSRGGSFGLGDALIPFARVPGNVVGQFLNYTPAGAVRGIGELAGVLRDARRGTVTAEQQAQAARDIGRGLNGTALLAGLAALAAKGLLNVADGGDTDDEKDLAKLRQSEGITGTQWNLSATIRAAAGGSAEWKDGDDLLNIGFLEPVNGLMALAALIADSREDGDLTAREIANDTMTAAVQSIADLPAMSSLTGIINNYKYAEGDTGDKIAMTGAQLMGDTVSSFIPNVLTGVAQGMDEGTVRQTYGSDKKGFAGVAEETMNSIKGKIPGARSTLPAALDNWGNERKTTASPAQNWLNSNILPGSITKYSTDRVNQEIERLAENAGGKVPDRSAEKSFTQDGKKYELSEKQKRSYQKVYGDTAHDGVAALLQASGYSELSASEKAEAVEAVLDYARQTARESVFPSYEVNSATQKARDAADELGMEPVEYLLTAAAIKNYNDDGKGSIRNDELEEALNDLFEDDEEMKSALWLFYGRSAKTNPFG